MAEPQVPQRDTRMVVGLDGSPGAATALAWAAARTDRFGPIQPVASWQYPWWSMAPLAPGAAALPPSELDFHAEARQVVDRMLADAGRIDHLEPLTVHGPAGQVLVGVSDDASLLVVGTRSHGSVAAGVLGSVSLYCVNHAKVPVAVIPADASAQDLFHRVVVGFDGSHHAAAALDWAVDTAPPDAVIEVRYCQRNTETVHADPVGAVMVVASETRPERAGQQLVEAAVARVVDRVGSPIEGRIRAVYDEGDPRHLLRLASADADLLVLGARGHHGVAHLLVGSVATALIHQPLVPTVVVP